LTSFESAAEKEKSVREMFDRISPRYDILNRILSFHFDTRWRAQAMNLLDLKADATVVDLGVGTGDLAFEAASRTRRMVVGVDISENMIRGAMKKSFGHAGTTRFVRASCLRLPFSDGAFDAAVTAFVLRNVSDLSLFFREAHRVLRRGGKFLSIEMFRPTGKFFAPFYLFYFYRLIPLVGGLLGADRQAYQYLAESVKAFGTAEEVAAILARQGLRNVSVHRVLSGAICFHLAVKD
jgi:demethylmenaquinone methyltransferase/2-methoxy-6-polyprenyl-1,4-benzoquinol methylase